MEKLIKSLAISIITLQLATVGFAAKSDDKQPKKLTDSATAAPYASAALDSKQKEMGANVNPATGMLALNFPAGTLLDYNDPALNVDFSVSYHAEETSDWFGLGTGWGLALDHVYSVQSDDGGIKTYFTLNSGNTYRYDANVPSTHLEFRKVLGVVANQEKAPYPTITKTIRAQDGSLKTTTVHYQFTLHDDNSNVTKYFVPADPTNSSRGYNLALVDDPNKNAFVYFQYTNGAHMPNYVVNSDGNYVTMDESESGVSIRFPSPANDGTSRETIHFYNDDANNQIHIDDIYLNGDGKTQTDNTTVRYSTGTEGVPSHPVEIYLPSGGDIQFSSDRLKTKDDSPVVATTAVTTFSDVGGAKSSEITYSYDNDTAEHNFTGYPLYSLSDASLSLSDEMDAKKYLYTTKITAQYTAKGGVEETTTTNTYNKLGLLVKSETVGNDGNLISTTYPTYKGGTFNGKSIAIDYQSSANGVIPNYDDLAPNYETPVQVISHTYASDCTDKNAATCEQITQLQTSNYNNHGQVTDQRKYECADVACTNRTLKEGAQNTYDYGKGIDDETQHFGVNTSQTQFVSEDKNGNPAGILRRIIYSLTPDNTMAETTLSGTVDTSSSDYDPSSSDLTAGFSVADTKSQSTVITCGKIKPSSQGKSENPNADAALYHFSCSPDGSDDYKPLGTVVCKPKPIVDGMLQACDWRTALEKLAGVSPSQVTKKKAK